MRNRANVLVVAVALAILSFAYARYDYTSKRSVTIGSTTLTATGHDLFGNWVKDEMAFAVIVPVALIAIGVGVAMRK